MAATNPYLWGIDLGGTKTEIAVIEYGVKPNFLLRERVSTDAHLGYTAIVAKIADLVSRSEKKLNLSPPLIGIGTPGVRDPSTSLMKNCNTTCLNGKDLLADLKRALKREVVMANDANCFALAEALYGSAKDYQNVFGVILGTGVGGGIVINRNVIQGHHGICGEWGHNVIEAQGAACYCGKRGCVERVISGPALQTFYQGLSGQSRNFEEILALSSSDTCAHKTIERLIEYFGRALSVVINILDPDVIVLGGGVSNCDLLYSLGRESVKANIFNNTFTTALLPAQLGDSAGVLGAALLAR